MNATNNGNQSIYAGPGVIECDACKGTGEVPINPDQQDSAVKTCSTCKGKGERRKTLTGLTKREHFAGQIHAGLLKNDASDEMLANQIATVAVVHADALLEALEK